MLNSKQRAMLRSISSNTKPSVIIGKDGITDHILEQINNCLHAKELVKVSILDGAEINPKDCLKTIAQKLNAEEVCSIGKKFVLYKHSDKKGIKHIQI